MNFIKLIKRVIDKRMQIYSPIFGTVNYNDIEITDGYINIKGVRHTSNGLLCMDYIDGNETPRSIISDKVMIYYDQNCNPNDWLTFIGISVGSLVRVNDEYYLIYKDKSKRFMGLTVNGRTYIMDDVIDSIEVQCLLSNELELFKLLLVTNCSNLRNSWIKSMMYKSLTFKYLNFDYADNSLVVYYKSDNEDKILSIPFIDLHDSSISPIKF